MKKLIKCGDHKCAPFGLICTHLAEGKSTNWISVTELDLYAERTEIENDWVCPECAAKWPNLRIAEVRLVCIHCIRKQRQQVLRDGQHRHSALE